MYTETNAGEVLMIFASRFLWKEKTRVGKNTKIATRKCHFIILGSATVVGILLALEYIKPERRSS